MSHYQTFKRDPPPPYSPIGSPGPSRRLPTYDLPDDFKYGVNIAESDLDIRMAFLRKVYAILTLQLLTTVIFSIIVLTSTTVQLWIIDNTWTLFLSIIGSFISLIALYWKSQSYPTNMILLGVFTLFESYLIGAVISVYDVVIVAQAFIITLGIFVGLTLFALQTKYDFSGFAPYLYAALWGSIIAGLIQLFLPYNSMVDFILALLTALVFSGYIIWDTQMIMRHISGEEYISAAVNLYLDFLNLFLAILRILNSLNRD
jgi:FtsH-binding integral membrane protein